MDREELRETRAPLKERYGDEPDAALVTLVAAGSLDDGVSCSVESGRALAQPGLYPQPARRLPRMLGRHAARGAGGLRRRYPARGGDFARDPHLSFDLETDAGEEELETLLKLTERHCVVFQTLCRPAELSSSLSAE